VVITQLKVAAANDFLDWRRGYILMQRLTRPVLFSLLLVLALSNNESAQTTNSGGLAGVVTDPSKAVVPAAYVEITDNAKGTTQATKTGRDGLYRFFFLSPGSYSLTVTRAGFRQTRQSVNVLVGPPVTVNVTLEIAKENTTVEVMGDAPLIQAENGDVSATMNQQQISEVPNPGNDLTYLVQTAPGVVMNTDRTGGANFSILGMPGTSYLYTMDGMNDVDSLTNLNLAGSLNLLLGQNQIQEGTVVSTGYSGQFGGAAGGNINYVTKSGGNSFHGNAQYYWSGPSLNVDSPLAVANQWAASLGGPIKKNKLFFFFDSEGMRLELPQIFGVVIPSPQFEAATIANIDARFGSASASNAFYRQIFDLYDATPGANSAAAGGFSPGDLGCTNFVGPAGLGTSVACARHFIETRARPSQDALTSGRADWDIRRSDRAFFRLQYDGGHSSAHSDPISPAFDADFKNPWWQGQLNETHTFGSSGASQFLLAGSYLAPILGLTNPSQGLSAFPANLGFAQGPFTVLGPDWFYSKGIGRYETHFQLAQDVVKTSGSHKFGFGANFEKTYWSLLAYGNNAVAQLVSLSLDAFYQGGFDPASPDVNFTQLNQSFPSALSHRLSFYDFGLYAQDDWHARPDLTFTIALRAEHYSNPLCEDGCFTRMAGPFDSVSHDPDQPYNQALRINQRHAYQATDRIVWSPRASFAWQPLGLSSRSVIRGGIGFFHDPPLGVLPYALSFTSPLVVNFFTIAGNNLTPDEKTSLFKDAHNSNEEFINSFRAGKNLAQIRAKDPNFSPPALGLPGRVTHSPQYQRWSLQWQQAFGAGTSLSVGYFGHHGIHEMVENWNTNAYGFGSLPAGLCTHPPVAPCADPRFGWVVELSSDAVSSYNGMVISFQHRFSRAGKGILQANYTYGHALDEVSNGGDQNFTFGGSAIAPQDPSNFRGEYGAAEYDVRHSFNASYVWELPVKPALRGHGSSRLLEGWQVSGTIFGRTGFPYSVFDYAESIRLAQNNYMGLIYAVPAGPLGSGSSCGDGAAFPAAPHPCQPSQFLDDGQTPNPKARFVQSGCETGFNSGNLPGPSGPCSGPAVSFAQGRNRFRGPGYFNADLAIMKNTKIPGRENGVLGLGFQFFDLFNRLNLSLPDNAISSPTFGQIFSSDQSPTSILGENLSPGGNARRMIQLKAQLTF